VDAATIQSRNEALNKLQQQKQQLERRQRLEHEQLLHLEQLSQQGQFSSSVVAKALRPEPQQQQLQQQQLILLQQQQRQRELLQQQRQFNPMNSLSSIIDRISEKAIKWALLSVAKNWLEQAHGNWGMLHAEVASTVSRAAIVEPFCVKQNTAAINPSDRVRVVDSQNTSEIESLRAKIDTTDKYLDRLMDSGKIALWFYLFGKQFLSQDALLKEIQNGTFSLSLSLELVNSLSLSLSLELVNSLSLSLDLVDLLFFLARKFALSLSLELVNSLSLDLVDLFFF
jgi:hypothetical protein